MVIVYGSILCKDYRIFAYNADLIHLEYESRSITDNLAYLKEFLKYRDSNPDLFAPIKERNGIGIPLILDGTNLILDYESYLHSCGLTQIVDPEKVDK